VGRTAPGAGGRAVRLWLRPAAAAGGRQQSELRPLPAPAAAACELFPAGSAEDGRTAARGSEFAAAVRTASSLGRPPPPPPAGYPMGWAPPARGPDWGCDGSPGWGHLLTGDGQEEVRYRSLVETVRRGAPAGRPPTAPPLPGPGLAAPAALGLAQVTQLAILEALGRHGEDQSAGGAAWAGRALKRLHAFQDRVRIRPREVVDDYLAEIT
jgi:hypothetical protein